MAERSASADGVAAGGVSGSDAADPVQQSAGSVAAEGTGRARPAGNVQVGQRGAAGDAAGGGAAVAMAGSEVRDPRPGGAVAIWRPAHDDRPTRGVSGSDAADPVQQSAGSVAAEGAGRARPAGNVQAGQRGAAGDAAGDGAAVAMAGSEVRDPRPGGAVAIWRPAHDDRPPGGVSGSDAADPVQQSAGSVAAEGADRAWPAGNVQAGQRGADGWTARCESRFRVPVLKR